MAVHSWGMNGATLHKVVHSGVGHSSTFNQAFESTALASAEEDFDCAICMTNIQEAENCILLPCYKLFKKGCTPGAQLAGRPHAFHTSCIETWWCKSCRCPTCRCDVRQFFTSKNLPHKSV